MASNPSESSFIPQADDPSETSANPGGATQQQKQKEKIWSWLCCCSSPVPTSDSSQPAIHRQESHGDALPEEGFDVCETPRQQGNIRSCLCCWSSPVPTSDSSQSAIHRHESHGDALAEDGSDVCETPRQPVPTSDSSQSAIHRQESHGDALSAEGSDVCETPRQHDIFSRQGSQVALQMLATVIRDKVIELKGSGGTNVQTSAFSMETWLRSSTVNEVKEFLSQGMDCADSLAKLTPGKGLIHSVSPLLNTIGSYHWITSVFFLVGKTLERWELVSENKETCLTLLQEMCGLALLLKQIKYPTEDLEKLIKRALEMIIRGYRLCSFQTDCPTTARIFNASDHKEDLIQLQEEIGKTYRDISTQMTTCIYDVVLSLNKIPPRARGVIYPKKAEGIDGQVQRIITTLNFESKEKALAVVLHNFGGMGKTTLAKAVFSCLEIKDCKYSMVTLFKDTKAVPDIIELQKTIIGDLTGEKAKDFDSYEEGQSEIKKILTKVTAFIFIDNVLESGNSKQLRQLLPQDFSNAKKTRLLITARDKTVVTINLYGSACRWEIFSVEELADESVLKLLREVSSSKLLEKEEMELVQMCRGVPLFVDLMSRFIGSYENGNMREAYDVVKGRYKQNLTPEGSMTLFADFAIDALNDECKECFFDICCSYVGESWQRMKMALGKDALHLVHTLESKALIFRHIISSNDEYSHEVGVHDVLIDTARKDKRNLGISSDSYSSFSHTLSDAYKARELGCIKYVQQYGRHYSTYSISATCLDVWHGSIKALVIPHGRIQGECINYLRELKVLKIYSITHFQLEKMPNLRVLEVESNLTEKLMETICTFSTLQFLDLHLHGLRKFDYEVMELIGELLNLRYLTMRGLPFLKSLPKSIGCLSSLEVLKFTNCFSLESLPTSFINLTSLHSLHLEDCCSLRNIPDDLLESLPSLRCLFLDNAKMLQLPNAIVKLQRLEKLSLRNCSLQQLPDGFGGLSSLKVLDMNGCWVLVNLCNDFDQLNSLKVLDLRGCRSLEGKWRDSVLKLPGLEVSFD